MRTLVITNQKGGCGKTTTSVNLAAAMAQMGHRTLLIDLDPQAHATLGLGYDPENLENTVFQVITNKRFSISKAILDTKIEGLHLIPSNIRLAKVEQEMALVSQKEFILADQLKKISSKYDTCIIDCPPSLGLLTFNALVASTDIIVPVQVHYYALEGLKQLLETVKIARKRFYPCSIRILGLLLTFVEDRAALSQQVEQQMKKFFGDLVFKTVIHRTISLAEAPSAGESILTYAPESKGTAEYKALAKEILDSENKDKAKEPQEIAEIVDKIQTADVKIIIEPAEKSKEQAEDSAPEEEDAPAKETIPPRKIKSAGQYYIPKRETHIGKILFLLALLIITIAVAVVTFINNPPTAEQGNVNVPEDTPTQFFLTANDKDRDDLTYKVITDPAHGILSGIAPELTYTPEEDYTGPDSFTFMVSDKRADSNAATVSIMVTPVNDPPAANPQTLSIKLDKSLPITLTGKDSDSDNLTFSITTEPKNGAISQSPGFEKSGKIVYTPKSGFMGTDSFTFVTNDSDLNSEPETILINITANNPPAAEILSISTVENAPVTITLKGSDRDDDTLTYKIMTEPLYGKLSGDIPNLTYTPNDHYSGTDSFTYKANDGMQDSIVAAVTLTVKSIDDPPVAKPAELTTQEDMPLPVTLAGTDPDSDTLTYHIVSQPSHGTLSPTRPNLIYTPDNNYSGSDSFSFKVSDGTSESAAANVSINITPMEDPPVAVSGNSIFLNEDTPATFVLEANDPDGDILTYIIEREPTGGTLSGTGPEMTYTPNKDFSWIDSFKFSVSDGKTKSSPAVVYITVNSVNDPPAAKDDAAETYEDQPIDKINVLANDTDIDKDPLTIKDVTQGSHGTVEINPDNTLKYIPEPNYYGTDSFTYNAQDPDGLTAAGKVEIKITQLNDSPQIISTPATTAMLDVLYIYEVNAVDPDGGDKITYSLLAKPDGMTIGENTGIIEWLPNDILSMSNQVTVKVTDNNDIPASSTQTFTIQVDPAPPKISTLNVIKGYGNEGKNIFSDKQDANIVTISDNKYLEIKPDSYIAFDFSNITMPHNAKITSFVIFIEHYEQDLYQAEKEKWTIGKDWPDNPDVWFTIVAPIREGEKNDAIDSWDAASFVDTPEKMNKLQLQIYNDDSSSSIFIDHLYILAQWEWPESPGLVEYKLEPVR